ncbi:hypothetical protein FHT72_006518 [Rhizobium sp. BK077]|nr:hypothetical protein [Rhizobium sp. BK112]MBB3371986.1 hypothetical protein [Rhizobium sp. BK077]MBB4182952.1 hypothetical protein [Rhizobium sp. BK109]
MAANLRCVYPPDERNAATEQSHELPIATHGVTIDGSERGANKQSGNHVAAPRSEASSFLLRACSCS